MANGASNRYSYAILKVRVETIDEMYSPIRRSYFGRHTLEVFEQLEAARSLVASRDWQP